MPKIIDRKALIGERHEMLTIVGVNESKTEYYRRLVVDVVCDCGTKKTMLLGNFRITKSCGCARYNKNNRYLTYNGETHSIGEWSRRIGINVNTIRTRLFEKRPIEEVLCPTLLHHKTTPLESLMGRRFGRLVVIGEFREGGKPRVRCKCDCGEVFETGRYGLLNGTCKSCGCYRADLIRQRGAVVRYKIGDEEHTVKEWAEKMGITERTFYNRVRRMKVDGEGVRRKLYYKDKVITNIAIHI